MFNSLKEFWDWLVCIEETSSVRIMLRKVCNDPHQAELYFMWEIFQDHMRFLKPEKIIAFSTVAWRQSLRFTTLFHISYLSIIAEVMKIIIFVTMNAVELLLLKAVNVKNIPPRYTSRALCRKYLANQIIICCFSCT